MFFDVSYLLLLRSVVKPEFPSVKTVDKLLLSVVVVIDFDIVCVITLYSQLARSILL